MTGLKTYFLLKLDRLFGGVVLVVLLIGSGCNKTGTNAPPPRAKETSVFWERFKQAAISGTGVEALQSPAYQGPVAARDTYAVLADIVDSEQMRSRTITALPGLRVDPELVAYAAEFSKSRRELAGVAEDYLELAKEQEDVTGQPGLGAGLLGDLINPGEKGADEIIWRALSDQAQRTGKDFQRLRAPAVALEARAAAVRGELGRLTTDEIGVRVKLVQRFGGEFPPRETHASAAATTHAKGTPLFENQIIVTLLGRSLGGLMDGWTFESPQEFVSLKILSATNHSDVLADYDVQARVKGARTGVEREFKLHLSYGRLHTRWVLLEMHQLK